MAFVRMQAPEGLSSFAHQGYKMDVDVDGVAQVDPRNVPDFEAHGFTRMISASPPVLHRPPAGSPGGEPVPGATVVPMREVPPGVVALLDRLMGASPETLARLSAALTDEPETMTLDASSGPLVPPPVDPAAIQAADPRPPVAEPEGIPAEGKLTDDQIQRMTLAQMKAWCRERDIPIKDADADVLRAKIIHANAA